MNISTPVQPPPLECGQGLLIQLLSENLFKKLGPRFDGRKFLGVYFGYALVEGIVKIQLKKYFQSLGRRPRVSNFIRFDDNEVAFSTDGIEPNLKIFLGTLGTELRQCLSNLGILQKCNWQQLPMPRIPVVPFLLFHVPLRWLHEGTKLRFVSLWGMPLTPMGICKLVASDPGLECDFTRELKPTDFKRYLERYAGFVRMIEERRTERLHIEAAWLIELAPDLCDSAGLALAEKSPAFTKARNQRTKDLARKRASKDGQPPSPGMTPLQMAKTAIALCERVNSIVARATDGPKTPISLNTMGVGAPPAALTAGTKKIETTLKKMLDDLIGSD